MRVSLRKLRLVDSMWNERSWARYADLLDDSLEAWVAGEAEPHGKIDHIERAQSFCEAFPDALRHLNYLDLFASPDGLNTFSVARCTGTAVSTFRLPGGSPMMPTSHRFDVPVMLACRWKNGRIVRLRENIDHVLISHQLAGTADLHAPAPDASHG